MKFEQKKRLEKIYNEPFYLLDVSKKETQLLFNVSGSTANIYETSIYLQDKSIFCSCPDAKSYAKKNKVICKHACFVLVKVLKINSVSLLETEFLDNDLKFTQNFLQIISDKFIQLQAMSQRKHDFVKEDYINQEYLEKYNKMQELKKNPNPNPTPTPNPELIKPTSKYQLKKEIVEDLECMICFDTIQPSSSSSTDIVECPICHNLIHNECMKKWIQNGKKTCIYCRSLVWKDFTKEKTSSSSSSSSTEYSNLLQI